MHKLCFFDPGHFHAALLLREDNPRVDPQIHIYAPAGPDLDKFLTMVQGFCGRANKPTHWRIESHICATAADALAKLMAERHGDIVVLAGKNAPRLADMHHLHDAGFEILADKPWIINSADLPHLEAVTKAAPLAMDIMTARHDVNAKLRRRIMATAEIFGDLGEGPADLPAIEIGSTHHLLKLADGRPLQRPPWYYDVNVQGDGVVDIQSHMTDQAQWLIQPINITDQLFDYSKDIEILEVKRWTTPVDLPLFCESTGETAFPPSLLPAVHDNILQLACNGRIDYRLRGIWIRQHAQWDLREPAGGGDTHHFVARGGKAELQARHDAETNYETELHLRLNGDGNHPVDLDGALDLWRRDFPGLEMASSAFGYRFILPPALIIGHEAQFPLVLDEFLDHLDSGVWPAQRAAAMRMRYTLLAKAREAAQD